MVYGDLTSLSIPKRSEYSHYQFVLLSRYGFVSFKDPADFTRAIKELNGKYVGSRPIKLSKSNWKDRNIDIVKSKQTVKKQMGYKY